MGIFEKPPFDNGTVALAKAVAESGAVSVVGGGDSEKAIKAAGVTSKISHVSTGGGASLEFLAGHRTAGSGGAEPLKPNTIRFALRNRRRSDLRLTRNVIGT